jgi:hypothetical protein
MKVRSSPRELAGCSEVRQVLGKRRKDLVYRADETVVLRGNDANGVIDGRPVAGAFDPDRGESHAHGDWRKTRLGDPAHHAHSTVQG